MLHVVLDANAIGVDPPFSKLEHRVLLDAHRNGEIVLVVPRLALRESVNSWRAKLQSAVVKLGQARDHVRKLAPRFGGTQPQPDYAAAADRLLRELTGNLTAAGVVIPEVPVVDQDELIERALARRQPFNKEGSGFRDALLWSVVMELAAAGHGVALVSNDHDAFGYGRQDCTRLAQPLVDEIAVHGVSCQLFPNVHSAVDGLGLVAAEALDAVCSIFARNGPQFPETVRLRLVEALTHSVHRWVTRDLVNPFIAERVWLGLAYDALGLELLEARRLEQGRLEASAILEVRQFVTVRVSPGVLPPVADLGRVEFEDDDGLPGVEIEARVKHQCRLVLDPVGDLLISAEALEAVSASPGSSPPVPMTDP